jgi:ATP-dependent DNA helicase RecG
MLVRTYLDLKTWEPKVAGVLLFHDNPSAALPKKCAVKVIRYETREDEPERDHLGKLETIEGPLYLLVHKSIRYVQEALSGVKIWTVDGLKSVEYPPESLWEILVNAIIHRDYSVSDDRIEIRSPGKLHRAHYQGQHTKRALHAKHENCKDTVPLQDPSE